MGGGESGEDGVVALIVMLVEVAVLLVMVTAVVVTVEMTDDEMVGWHHWLNGHEFEQTLGDSEDRGAWRSVVHGIAKSWTRFSN